MLFVDTHKLDWTYLPVDFDGALIYGVDTHAPSALSPSEEAGRQLDCVHCVEMMSGHNGCSLQEFTEEELTSSIGRVPETVRRYCLHIVCENERVLHCRQALSRGDLRWVGKLLNESHESLRDLYEGTSPEVDWLVKHSHEVHGVYGARLAGGSTGTCALILASRDAEEHLRQMLREYERIFGFHPDVLTCRPDSGVAVESREGT